MPISPTKGPIVYFGSPEFAVPTLKSLVEAGESIAAVVTRPDTRRGRGGAHMPSPVKAAALEMGLRVLEPSSIREPWFVDEMKSLRPEFLVVVAYGRILNREILDIPSRAPVNLHASMLPRYRGAAPINWAILNGDTETGICTMLMSEGLDEGDKLICESFSIGDDEDALALAERLSNAGGSLVLKTLDGMRDGSVKPVPQKGEPTYARMLRKDDGLIDWTRPARELYNHVRGMQPWPGAFTRVQGAQLKVLRARVDASVGPAGSPGEVLLVERESFTVRSGDCALEILEVKPEGKQAMSAGAYARGHGVRAGVFMDGFKAIDSQAAEARIKELYNYNDDQAGKYAALVGHYILDVDADSWNILINEVKGRKFSPDDVNGNSVTDVINEIRTYCFFKKRGYQDLKFIKSEGTPTPDIEGSYNGDRVFIEVKTINRSKEDEERIARNTSIDEKHINSDEKDEEVSEMRDVECSANKPLLKKLSEGLEKALNQLKTYSDNRKDSTGREDLFVVCFWVNLDNKNISPADKIVMAEVRRDLEDSLTILKNELGIDNHCDIYLKGNCE